MALQDSIGQPFALLLWSKDSDDEDDVALYNGIIRQDQTNYYIDRGSDKPRFELRNEWLERIETVPDDLREMLRGAVYQLSLKVGDLDTVNRDHIHTGLQWPVDQG